MVVEVADVVDEDEAEGETLTFMQPNVCEAGGVCVLDAVYEVTI